MRKRGSASRRDSTHRGLDVDLVQPNEMGAEKGRDSARTVSQSTSNLDSVISVSSSATSPLSFMSLPTSPTSSPSFDNLSRSPTPEKAADKRKQLSSLSPLKLHNYYFPVHPECGALTSRELGCGQTPQHTITSSTSEWNLSSAAAAGPRGDQRSGAPLSFFKHKTSKKEKQVARYSKTYPCGHRGFLEEYSDNLNDSEHFRDLGINSFADVESFMRLFSKRKFDLDRDVKVFISNNDLIRMAIEKETDIQEILDRLRLYDRYMYYLVLDNPDAAQAYKKGMTDIFFSVEKPTIYSIFNAILPYDDLKKPIQKIVFKEDYHRIYSGLINVLQDYKNRLSKGRKLKALQDRAMLKREELETVTAQCPKTVEEYSEQITNQMPFNNCNEINQGNSEKSSMEIEPFDPNIQAEFERVVSQHGEKIKKLQEELKLIGKKIREKEKGLMKHRFSLIPEFRLASVRENRFFDRFSELREQDVREFSMRKEALTKVILPKWNKDFWCFENMVTICLYFFVALFKRCPGFYGKPCHSDEMYINEKFASRIKQMNTQEEFENFVEAQKKNHDQGLLEIVLYKALEYISEEAQVEINYSVVIPEALQRARARCGEIPFYHCGKIFFEAAMEYVFENLKNPLPQSSESPSHGLSGPSGPAPKL